MGKMEKVEYGSRCMKCSRKKNFPKYSCRICCHAFTSNFVLDKALSYKYQVKVAKKVKLQGSDEKLRTLYSRIKEKYFNGNYVPDPNIVTFTWKRGEFSGGGVCWKSRKEIRIGGRYRRVFTYDAMEEKGLVMLMVHEMVHLRLAHHRKNFKQRTAEIQSLVRDEHMSELYAGLRIGQVN